MTFISKHPLVKHKLTRLRDTRIDHKKFRELVREIAILLAYEATADLSLRETTVTSPMGQATGHSERVATVLSGTVVVAQHGGHASLGPVSRCLPTRAFQQHERLLLLGGRHGSTEACHATAHHQDLHGDARQVQGAHMHQIPGNRRPLDVE